MHVCYHNFRNVKVCYRTKNLENWYQDEWIVSIVVLEQFWCEGQKRKHDLVAKIFKSHSMVNFLHDSRNNCLESFNGAKNLIEVAAVLEVVGNLGHDFRPVVRVLVLSENADDFSVSWSDGFFLAILNER